jgi:hypothetical protein
MPPHTAHHTQRTQHTQRATPLTRTLCWLLVLVYLSPCSVSCVPVGSPQVRVEFERDALRQTAAQAQVQIYACNESKHPENDWLYMQKVARLTQGRHPGTCSLQNGYQIDLPAQSITLDQDLEWYDDPEWCLSLQQLAHHTAYPELCWPWIRLPSEGVLVDPPEARGGLEGSRCNNTQRSGTVRHAHTMHANNKATTF